MPHVGAVIVLFLRLVWQRAFRYGLLMSTRVVGWLGLSLVGVLACADGGGFSPFEAATEQLAEAEPNDAFTTATLVTSPAWVTAPLFPGGDVDYYGFTANAGDLVFAAVNTSWASGVAQDSILDVIASDGTTVVETDDDDGTFGVSASSIAGTRLLDAGTYFLRVRAGSISAQLRPYDLFFQLRPSTVSAETEPNDDKATANQLSGGLVSGAIGQDGDNDVWAFTLAAGETVFVSLDADPERDGVTWNPRVELELPSGSRLAADDSSVVSPNSEALYFTVEEAGTYYVGVEASGAAGPTATYRLSVTAFPAPAPAPACTVHTVSETTVFSDYMVVESVINVPEHTIIGDLDVSVQIDHQALVDVDVTLTSPQGGTKVIFADVAASGAVFVNTVFDDDAALPIQNSVAFDGGRMRPRAQSRLDWFNGEDAAGDWTLRVYDDASGGSGTFRGWSLRICERQAGPLDEPIYATEFEEVDDAGWTHSGVNDEWARGTPSAAPFVGCHSGTKCWKTNLGGTYAASSRQVLVSPNITLPENGVFELSWAMKLQLEHASFDGATVAVRAADGARERVIIATWVRR